MAGEHDGLPYDAIASAVESAGFDLEEIVAPSSSRRVQIVVDSDDGVDLDRAAALSRTIADILDGLGDEPFGGRPYTLEVTSPGIGSPLTRPRHYRRAVGRLITVVDRQGVSRQVRLARVDDGEIVVISGDKKPTADVVPLDEITAARVEVEFSSPTPAVTALLASLSAAGTAPRGDHSAAGEAHDEEGTGSSR